MTPPVALCLRPARLLPESQPPGSGREPAATPGDAWGLQRADRSALEAALRLQAEGRHVVALAAGPAPAAGALRTCAAAGIGRGIFLEAAAAPDPFRVAEALADVIREIGANLVLCGDTLQEGVQQWNGPLLAEVLGWPQVTRACSVSMQENGELHALRHLERGERQLLACLLPAVLSLHPDAMPQHYISVFRLRAAGMMNLERRNPAGAAADHQAAYRLDGVSLPRPRPRRMAQPAASSSASQRMAFLMGGGRAQPRPESSPIFKGDAQQAATRILEFLREQGFLPGTNPPGR